MEGLAGMIENIRELLKAHEGLKHEVYLDLENSSMVPEEVVDGGDENR